MADADAAPAAPPKANPDLASDAELTARAAALVAALRSGDSDAQTEAADEIKVLVAALANTKPPQPANPRTVAALVAAGVGAALLPLIDRTREVGVSAAHALRKLMYVSDDERRAVVDTLGADKLLQLLHESQDTRRLNALVTILCEFTRCSEWMESLSPDSDLVSRIFSLPFLSAANALATYRALSAAIRLLDKYPQFQRTLACRTSLLVELLRLQERDSDSVELTNAACILLRMLQKQDGFDVLAFDEARVHIACVELLGRLCRHGVGVATNSHTEPTRVLATSFKKSPALRRRIHDLIFACPGALPGVISGMEYACAKRHRYASTLVSFLDDLHRFTPGSAELFLIDTHFAAYTFLCNSRNPACTQLRDTLLGAWTTPDCLRTMKQPLEHQKLAVAVSLACLSDEGVEFRRILATDDHLEILAQELVILAGSPRLGTVLTGDFQAWREEAVRQCVAWLVEDIRLNHVAADGDEVATAEPAAKRARTSRGTTLHASDVNVQRRDSTVLLIAGRPFYVNGALIETNSAVLADALSSAATLDPVAVALPNEVPEEQQYDLFHAAVELAYTGTIASDVAAEALLPLWCLGDHLQMDQLCAWCAERLVPVLAKDAALLERAWTTALARPSDALGDACAKAWLALECAVPYMGDITAVLVLKRVHESCALKELVAAQLARVLRKGLLASIAKNDEDDDEEDEEED